MRVAPDAGINAHTSGVWPFSSALAQRRHRFIAADAHSEVLPFSPYFVPGREALERIRALRAAGVSVRVATNSLAVSDESLVAVGRERHRTELPKMGVELYELSSTRLGSMNLAPRPANLNTETGARVDSPELAAMILGAFRVAELAGVYQVRLSRDGSGVRWSAVNGDATEEPEVSPDTSR